MVVAPGNVARAEEHFRGLGIRVVTGHHYLGGFIGDADAEKGLATGKHLGVVRVGETTGRGFPDAPKV